MFNNRQQCVNVSRVSLIEVLKAGRKQHNEEYVEAIKEYNIAVIKFLEGALERAKKHDHSDVVLRLIKPCNHTSDYTKVIEMLEESVDDTIQLDSDMFRAYYKGEWGWKGAFASASASVKTFLGSV